jgi:hypothetical protein
LPPPRVEGKVGTVQVAFAERMRPVEFAMAYTSQESAGSSASAEAGRRAATAAAHRREVRILVK